MVYRLFLERRRATAANREQLRCHGFTFPYFDEPRQAFTQRHRYRASNGLAGLLGYFSRQLIRLWIVDGKSHIPISENIHSPPTRPKSGPFGQRLALRPGPLVGRTLADAPEVGIKYRPRLEGLHR